MQCVGCLTCIDTLTTPNRQWNDDIANSNKLFLQNLERLCTARNRENTTFGGKRFVGILFKSAFKKKVPLEVLWVVSYLQSTLLCSALLGCVNVMSIYRCALQATQGSTETEAPIVSRSGPEYMRALGQPFCVPRSLSNETSALIKPSG